MHNNSEFLPLTQKKNTLNGFFSIVGKIHTTPTYLLDKIIEVHVIITKTDK